MPSFKPRVVVKILTKLGYIQKRQAGSHLIMFHPTSKETIPIPMHAKDIKKGLLQSIIKKSKSSEKEFLKLK
jgi:predicted RNA binding protein YcfA (HicA-like mRNA interferase family)